MCIERRDPYTGHIPGVTTPRPPVFTPEQEARFREIIREELEAHDAFIEDSTSADPLDGLFKKSMPRFALVQSFPDELL